jgi:hypothetical protein
MIGILLKASTTATVRHCFLQQDIGSSINPEIRFMASECLIGDTGLCAFFESYFTSQMYLYLFSAMSLLHVSIPSTLNLDLFLWCLLMGQFECFSLAAFFSNALRSTSNTFLSPHEYHFRLDVLYPGLVFELLTYKRLWICFWFFKFCWLLMLTLLYSRLFSGLI